VPPVTRTGDGMASPVDILLALKGGDSNYATWKVGS
jgi:hypothetical protein